MCKIKNGNAFFNFMYFIKVLDFTVIFKCLVVIKCKIKDFTQRTQRNVHNIQQRTSDVKFKANIVWFF